MADRDFNPKDGKFVRIMNEFIDKLIFYRLDSNEWSVLMLVIRLTWGVKGRAWAEIRWTKIMEKTGLNNTSVARSLKKLKDRNILQVKKDGKNNSYKINSKISTWKELFDITPVHGSNYYSRPREYITPVHGSILLPSTVDTSFKDNIKDNIKDTPIVPIGKNGDSGSIVLTKKEMIRQDAKQVIDFINFLSGKNFRHTDTSLKPIIARLNDGFTLEQCLQVCQNKWDDPDLSVKYYRPITLFRPSLFEGYVNEIGANRKPTDSRKEKRLEKWRRRYANYEKEDEQNQTD